MILQVDSQRSQIKDFGEFVSMVAPNWTGNLAVRNIALGKLVGKAFTDDTVAPDL